MDEFRNKHPSRRRNNPGSSIDGFSQPNRRQPRQNSSGSLNASPAATVSRLDNFGSAEGFTPRNRNTQINAFAKKDFSPPGDNPILIEKTGNGGKKGRLAKIWPFSRFNRKNKKPWSRKRKILTGMGVFLAILLMIFGFLVLKGYINLNKILKGGGGAAALEQNVDVSKLKGEGDGRVNILMLGTGGEGHDGADLTDTIIVASIDPLVKEAALVSIPRDLYVPVGSGGSKSSMKINAVFSTGKTKSLAKDSKSKDAKAKADEAGYNLLEQTVETQLGIPIHYRATVDFTGFKQAIDTVGGIDLNPTSPVKETLYIDKKNYRLDVKPGQQHMDGFKALAYSRSRYTSARGDFDRAERQRLVILALKQKVLSAGTYSNPKKISDLLGNLGNHVQTNFSAQDLSRLYQLGKEIDQSKISSIGLADPPNNYLTTGMIGGQSVVIPTAGNGNFKAIQGYLRNVLKDSFIRNENASILVLNGTSTPGLATTKGDELKSYGYNITQVGNAPTQAYPKTVVVDMRSGSKKYTKSYLEKRFKATSVSSIPDPTIQPGTADFVIILGSDQATSQ